MKSLGLRSFKGDGEWRVDGDATLLNLEREVHQLSRWKQKSGLRIDAIYGDAPCISRSQLMVGFWEALIL